MCQGDYKAVKVYDADNGEQKTVCWGSRVTPGRLLKQPPWLRLEKTAERLQERGLQTSGRGVLCSEHKLETHAALRTARPRTPAGGMRTDTFRTILSLGHLLRAQGELGMVHCALTCLTLPLFLD